MPIKYELLRTLGESERRPRQDAVIFSDLGRTEYLVSCSSTCVNFVLKGEERYEVDGRTHVVGAGEFLFVRSGVRAKARVTKPSGTKALCVYVRGEPLEWGIPALEAGDEEGLGPAGLPLVLTASASPFGRSLARIAGAVANDPEAGGSLCERINRHVMLSLPRFAAALDTRMSRVGAARWSTRAELLRRVDCARALLHEEGRDITTLAELAKRVGMSQFHLARTFKEVHGLPPMAYRKQLRLKRAAVQISAGTTSLREAAESLGYSEPSSLSRALREHRLRDRAGSEPV